tara:strand:- start:1259 stop:1753 length:495 start_codon:yes stop_codon:yes gene_type:complete
MRGYNQMMKLGWTLGLMLFLGACGAGTPSEVEFNFPDEESFIITHYMKLEAFEYQDGDEEVCEKLLKGLPIPNRTIFRNNNLDPCNMQNGTDLSEFDSQKAIYFIQGLNKWDLAIVSGCKVATLSESKTNLKIAMETTDNYPPEVNTLCENIENKCVLNMDCDY